jgi:hypothetical protein
MSSPRSHLARANDVLNYLYDFRVHCPDTHLSFLTRVPFLSLLSLGISHQRIGTGCTGTTVNAESWELCVTHDRYLLMHTRAPVVSTSINRSVNSHARPRTMSKSIHLYCPSNKRTVSSFVITPFQSNDQVLKAIRLVFQIPNVTLYTTDAKPIKLDSIQEDQRILVAASPTEIILPDSPPEFEFYEGQEGEDVDHDLDTYGEPWESLSEREKCNHVMSLNEVKPSTRNKLRIVRQWQPVLDDLTAVESEKKYDPEECEALIEQRWRSTIEHFLPTKIKTASKLRDPKVVAGIAVLSSITPGQSRLAAEILQEAIQSRVSDGHETSLAVQFQDIVSAVTIIFESAGVVAAKSMKAKSARAREKERKKALRGKAKEGAKGKGKAGGVSEKE